MVVSRKRHKFPRLCTWEVPGLLLPQLPSELRVGNSQKIKGGKRMGAKTPKAESLPPHSCCPNQELQHLSQEYGLDTGRTQAEALERYLALPVHRYRKKTRVG